MPPLVGGGMRNGICGDVVVKEDAPVGPPQLPLPLGVMLPPLPGRGGDELCMLKRLPPPPPGTLRPPLPPLHANELSEEGEGDVSAVGGEGGDEVELVGDVASERMAECAPCGETDNSAADCSCELKPANAAGSRPLMGKLKGPGGNNLLSAGDIIYDGGGCGGILLSISSSFPELSEPLPPSPLLDRFASCSPVESLLCSSTTVGLLFEQTSSMGSDLTSSAVRVSGDDVKLPLTLSLLAMPLPLPVSLLVFPLLPLPEGPLRFSSFRGGVLLLLCLMVEKSAGVNCGDELRWCTISGLLLLLDGKPLSGPRRRFIALFESSADGVELFRSRRSIAMLRLNSWLLMCVEANGSCWDGGGGGGEPLLREYSTDSSCRALWCVL